LIYVLKDEYDRLDNRAKFIDLVVNKKLIYINRKEEDVIADMKKHGLKPIYPRKKKNALIVDDENEPAEDDDNGYEYLFSISVRGFTAQKVADLNKQKDTKYEELQEIQGTPPKTFWRRDLDTLIEEWDAVLSQDEEDMKNGKPIVSGKTAKKRKRIVKPKVKVKVKEESTDAAGPMVVDSP
jgi:DNA topoisomerase-2